MIWLYDEHISSDSAVRFYGKFSPNFYTFKFDFCLGQPQANPSTIPPIELIIPDLQTGELCDNISVPPNFGILVSEKLKYVLDQTKVSNIHRYKTIIKRHDETIVSSEYYLGNIIGALNAVDFERPVLELDVDDGSIDFIDKLVIQDDLSLTLPIFRIKEYLPLLAVTDELKTTIISAGCTGVKFMAPEKLKL